MNKTKSNKEKSCRQVIAPESKNGAKTATPALFGPVSRCVRFFREQREQTPARAVRADLGRFRRSLRGRKSKLDKEPGSLPRLSPGTSARSADSYGSFGVLENGVKNSRETKFCGRYPATLTPTRKN